MIALECTPGGDLEKARQYAILSLERSTRPRAYEVALISAGRLLQDHPEAMKALQLAIQLLMRPVPSSDPELFPFATKLRWIYKFQTLDWAAEVLNDRAGSMINSADARELGRMRNEVLLYRRSLKPRLLALGVKPGEEGYKFADGTMDEIMFQLLDPEAVLEEEEMMRIAPSMARPKLEFEPQSSRISFLSKGMGLSPPLRKEV